jgi:acetyl-CoA carboxylase beta subunit
VCASGGARLQEGSLSLMQMGKIACAVYNNYLSYFIIDAEQF